MTARIIPFPRSPWAELRYRLDEPEAVPWGSAMPVPHEDPGGTYGRLSLDEVRAILAPARAAIEHARRTKP